MSSICGRIEATGVALPQLSSLTHLLIMTSDATPSYVPSCGCGRCAFDDCLAKRVQAKVPLWTHPGTIGGLSFIKEVSAGLPVPGMRSAAGAMLSIVDQIAVRGIAIFILSIM